MPIWVSLLRGVNLGAHNRVNMPQLRQALAADGFQEIRTYLQSGNVVARSAHSTAAQVAQTIGAVLNSQFGLDVPVVVRSPQQLREVLAWCPFPEDAAQRPTAVHVIHLTVQPDRDRVEALLSRDWAPDGLAFQQSEIVIRYATTMHASRLQHATLLRSLGVDGTARNWRTLQALVQLTPDG